MSTTRRVAAHALLLATVSMTACTVEPAPADLDGLPVWFWQNYSDASPEVITDGVDKLYQQSLKNAVEYGDPLKYGLKSRLNSEEIKSVEMRATNDPSRARGSILIDVIKCPLSKVEPLLYDLHQEKLYPDDYKAYSRQYTSSFDAYTSRVSDTLSWTVDTRASHAGTEVTAHHVGGMRWVKKVEGAALGPFILSRTALVEPAKTDDSDAYLRQDYLSEVYFERAPGETVHMYATWTEAKFFGFDSEGDVLVSFLLDALYNGDKALEEICRK